MSRLCGTSRENGNINYTLSCRFVSFQASDTIHPLVESMGGLTSPERQSAPTYRAGYKTILLRYRERKHIAVIVELSRPAEQGDPRRGTYILLADHAENSFRIP